ncbi:hypothetical protein FLACOL7796_01182 [Flavobacterium collinsii]|uniref:Uncharacterized protein n=1 Tax=Flavobacterium collinsii TaxID=1114861 RepID=A0ABM8KFW6_9FLAO|nr:hypothetical protein FLACOL7796_01182 [Flavobacterium collinsii]
MKIFKYLYYNLYFKSLKHNASPEIPIIGYISFAQTNNVLSIVNLFLFFTKWIKNYNLPVMYVIIQISLFIINYYCYVARKNGELIIMNKKYSLGKLFFLTDVYLFSSTIIMGVTFYLYKEY